MSREAMLRAIRAGLGRGPLSADARAELDGRLARHKASLIPAAGRAGPAARAARFQERAEAAAGTVERLAGAAEVPAAVARYLRQRNLEPELALAPAPDLAALPWADEPLLRLLPPGAVAEAARTALTAAFAGVAETGTLVTLSGPEHPAALNFLPEHHIVVLREAQLVDAYEDAWARLRKARRRRGGLAMPRSLSLITGPSRTGDIELVIQLGAHGPRGLHILLIAERPEGEDGEAG